MDEAKKEKRPALVWTTQILAAVLFALNAIGILSLLVNLPVLFETAGLELAISLLVRVALGVFLYMVVWGLVEPKEWARPLSIVFAALIPVLLVASRAFRSSPPAFEIADDELLGAAVAESIIVILVVVYPLRMYFSKSVRRFFSESAF
jgi:cell division protein FtsW (lipid II flippase)